MTIVYSAITHLWAFQISDRLLTRTRNSSIEKFDPVSNKTIIYVAKNGIVSLSYTGTAYIGDKTTDKWIAEILHGKSLETGSDLQMAADAPTEQGLYDAIETLVIELNKIWPRIPKEQRKADINISIAGWQTCHTKPKIRPVLWYLSGNGTDDDPFIRKSIERFYPLRMIRSTATGVTLSKQNDDLIHQAILQERKKGTEVTAEESIVKNLRNIYSSTETVGSDYMCVRITLYSKPQIFIKYYPNPNKIDPESPHRAPIEHRAGLIIGICKPGEVPTSPPDIESSEVYFSPWLISKNVVIPPSSVVGTNTVRLGGNIEAKIYGPAGNDGVIGGFVSQERPGRPSK